MNFTTVFTRLKLPKDLDGGVAESYGAIADRLAQLGAVQTAAAAELRSLKATKPELVDSKVVGQTRDASNRLLDTLRDELKIRTALAAWYPGFATAWGEMVDARSQAANEHVARVHAQLEEIGFRVATIPPKLLPGLHAAHPELNATQRAYLNARDTNLTMSRLEDAEGDVMGLKANAARMEEIRQILAQALRNAGMEAHGEISQY